MNEGEVRDFLITVTNQGPSQATDVSVGLNLPPNTDVVNVAVGDTTNSLEHFTVDAGQSLTMTVSVLFLEDSKQQNIQLGATARAVESALAQGSSPAFKVLNTNPVAILSDTLTVNEGEWGVLSVYMNDAGTTYDPLTAQWDLNNDGFFDNGTGASVLFNARAIDGPTTRLIAVRVTDDEGGAVTVTGTLTIKNVAPTVDIGEDQNHVYNQPFVLDVLASDPGPGDDSNYKLTVNWGDGTVQTTIQTALQPDAGSRQLTHTYNQIGEFTAKVCLDDNEGGVQCDQTLLEAACQEHGLVARVTNTITQATITLENASGSLPIPVGLPVTLYSGRTALKTFRLDQPIAVGQSRTLQYSQSTALEAGTLQAIVDDDGAGKKITQLCSGSVSQTVNVFKIFVPVVSRR